MPFEMTSNYIGGGQKETAKGDGRRIISRRRHNRHKRDHDHHHDGRICCARTAQNTFTAGTVLTWMNVHLHCACRLNGPMNNNYQQSETPQWYRYIACCWGQQGKPFRADSNRIESTSVALEVTKLIYDICILYVGIRFFLTKRKIIIIVIKTKQIRRDENEDSILYTFIVPIIYIYIGMYADRIPIIILC